jgi:hypothetical protein
MTDALPTPVQCAPIALPPQWHAHDSSGAATVTVLLKMIEVSDAGHPQLREIIAAMKTGAWGRSIVRAGVSDLRRRRFSGPVRR